MREELFSAPSLCPLPTCRELSLTSSAPAPDNSDSPQRTGMGSASPGPSGPISIAGLTSVRGGELGSSHLLWRSRDLGGRKGCWLPLGVLAQGGGIGEKAGKAEGSRLVGQMSTSTH